MLFCVPNMRTVFLKSLLWSISKLPLCCVNPRKYLILVKLVIKLMSVYSFIDLKEPGVGSPETLAQAFCTNLE